MRIRIVFPFLLLVSLCLPVVAMKLSLPLGFHGKWSLGEIQDLSVPLPPPRSKGKWVLRSPFREAQKEKASLVPPSVTFIYCGKSNYAIVNGQIVKEGDRIEGWQVVRIEPNRVLFRYRSGEERWARLSLLP